MSKKKKEEAPLWAKYLLVAVIVVTVGLLAWVLFSPTGGSPEGEPRDARTEDQKRRAQSPEE